MGNSSFKKDDITIVLGGSAGQGIQTVEHLLTKIFQIKGYNLYSTKEYMSRVRGGSNSTEIRVSSKKVRTYVDRIDILFPLTKESLEHLKKRMDENTIIIGDKSIIGNDEYWNERILDIPFSLYAEEIGGEIFSNIIAVGVISSLFGIERDIIEGFIRKRFSKKGDDIVEKNIKAIEKGYNVGKGITDSGKLKIAIEVKETKEDEFIISGTEAIGLGAIAGGCNFNSAYPMTPSTGIMTFLAQHAKEFDIVVEQAEDEIAAVNMAIGAWYAGSRALVSTAGGGFALMAEGISLAGVMESPLVVALGQRPSPATGLPTRTEQSDLDFALYAGHGEFPRIIYAPGTIEDAFYITQKSFNMADKHQVPVFILFDQYLADSYYNLERPDAKKIGIENYIVKTDKKYKRYALGKEMISPRGIPGWGEGLVAADSDEHDESGHITESHEIRISMMNKRLGKLKNILADAVPPEIYGKKDAQNLVICWGSTFYAIKEALDEISNPDISLLYFKQVYPLHPDTQLFFQYSKRNIIIENNATSQFGRLLKTYADITIHEKILKYDGLPFSVEEITGKIKEIIK